MLEILGKTNIDFMGKRRLAFIFSGIMVVLGLVALIQIGRGSANLGIDFSGGTAVQLKFDQPIRIDEARKILEANGLGNAELQEFGQENKLLIRLKTSTNNLIQHKEDGNIEPWMDEGKIFRLNMRLKPGITTEKYGRINDNSFLRDYE